jgi:hypothetical protein
VSAVQQFTAGEQADDITLVVARCSSALRMPKSVGRRQPPQPDVVRKPTPRKASIDAMLL